MSLLNKKYCSHCGTPNPRENLVCAKCGKPISSALKTSDEGVVTKRSSAKAVRYVYEDEDEFTGGIVVPSSSDVVIERPQKLTVGSLKNGAGIPSFGQLESLPTDIEVSSRSYFHNEKLD